MRAILDRLLVEVVETEKTTESGIIISGEQTDYLKGKVVSVGKDVKEVKVGDIVHFDKSRDKVKIDGLVALNETYILGVE